MSAETPIETVERLAGLARIAIPANNKEALAQEFESVRAYIGQLDDLTLTKSSTPAAPPLHNIFRKDEGAYTPGTWTARIVKLFPFRSGNSLSVKKIIAHD